ncbi:MAG: hypothetical protein B7Z08_08245 [Sphingomonadales bacterium 32-68-7]|nr:MAG: hypothetical protein B7Z33_10035 [Sphingomonadales bacterium 12-68-11]OYX08704.1 MAG: hypothetical protein B7Z08_08245 [Sphingomonadales bacterium 32-68-7]
MLSLAACASESSDAPAEQTATPVAAAAGSGASPDPSRAPVLVPEAEKGETGARNVLLEWARDLERGDYDGAFAQWGADAEARSGMTADEHAAYWRRFKTITVSVPEGVSEGAAGSLYYEVPATIVGKQASGTPYRLEGTVVLKRVNDVDGATADQLRWHMQQVDLHDVS